MKHTLRSHAPRHSGRWTTRRVLSKVIHFFERVSLLITEEVAWRTLILLVLVPFHFPGSGHHV